MLQHDNRIGSRRQDAAGGNVVAGTRCGAMFREFAHGNLAAYFQVGGQFFTGTKGVPGPDRIAVHGGTGVGRQVLR